MRLEVHLALGGLLAALGILQYFTARDVVRTTKASLRRGGPFDFTRDLAIAASHVSTVAWLLAGAIVAAASAWSLWVLLATPFLWLAIGRLLDRWLAWGDPWP